MEIVAIVAIVLACLVTAYAVACLFVLALLMLVAPCVEEMEGDE